MLALAIRLVGFILLAAGLVLLVVDASHSIAASEIVTTPLGETWLLVHPASLALAQSFIQAHVEPYFGAWVWYPVIQWLLAKPGFAVLGIAGAVLILLGRRRRRVR